MPPILLFLVNAVFRNGTQMNLGADRCVGKSSCGLPVVTVSWGLFTFCGGMAADFGNQQKGVLPGAHSFVPGHIWPSRKSCHLSNHVVVQHGCDVQASRLVQYVDTACNKELGFSPLCLAGCCP